MRLAVCSDELYPIHHILRDVLEGQGHQLTLFGALETGQEASWVDCAFAAAQAIQQGACEEGIFCCWTGTGVTLVANKVPGIRAALCGDPETARGARVWNHANVLGLSNRLLTPDLLKEILEAWFAPFDPIKGAKEVNKIKKRDRSQGWA